MLGLRKSGRGCDPGDGSRKVLRYESVLDMYDSDRSMSFCLWEIDKTVLTRFVANRRSSPSVRVPLTTPRIRLVELHPPNSSTCNPQLIRSKRQKATQNGPPIR